MARVVIKTASGPAWADLDVVAGSRLLVIGHGAGGDVDAADLLATRDCLLGAGISVARVTQPYRVAGRKAPPSAPVLDQAWADVVAALGRRKALQPKEFLFGGRSSGARVACRAAGEPAARPARAPRLIGVVALAFPVHPPGKPEKSRLAELAGVAVPALVVQGDRDPFGHPGESDPGRALTVVTVPGDHSLKRSAALVGTSVAEWITRLPS